MHDETPLIMMTHNSVVSQEIGTGYLFSKIALLVNR